MQDGVFVDPFRETSTRRHPIEIAKCKKGKQLSFAFLPQSSLADITVFVLACHGLMSQYAKVSLWIDGEKLEILVFARISIVRQLLQKTAA